VIPNQSISEKKPQSLRRTLGKIFAGFFLAAPALVLAFVLYVECNRLTMFEAHGPVPDKATVKRERTMLLEKALQGDADAQLQLGDMYWTGNGRFVLVDMREGLKWIYNAAMRGNPRAQVTLGAILYYGRSPEDLRPPLAPNHTEAYFWTALACAATADNFAKASAAAYKDSRDRAEWIRQRLISSCKENERLLTPEQKKSVQKRLDEWQPTQSSAILPFDY
jgi:TPR repeat protein